MVKIQIYSILSFIKILRIIRILICKLEFCTEKFTIINELIFYFFIMYSSDLYAQNKIEVQIKFKEKIKSISIEGENFSKRMNAGSNLEVFLEIPKYGSYTILAENENGVLKKNSNSSSAW
ncbi:hypothetical protein LEP1GSC059_2623 [Leptospira noguchii serovar Panama str. CZ214]|uniref:Uncharacterized protein n=1 Tax=Leptospira noguchii serovar Panama str. CZ214 TaxID=1001595 RepID=T0GV88_9LEPT|nr:hypothetical protein LEP1GSC059_2623 [Leptospira noguchii serovar Panama str. CZ214]